MALSLSGTTGIVTGNIGNSQVTSGKLASGAARANFGAGAVLQVVQGVQSTVQNSLTSTSFDDIPGLSASITPASTSNKILVTAHMHGCSTSNVGVRLMRDSTPIGVNTSGSPSNRKVCTAAEFYANNLNTGETVTINFLDSPSSVSAITYKIQYIAPNGGVFCLNSGYFDADNTFTLRTISTITLMEIAG
jgi:hypothetical protein